MRAAQGHRLRVGICGFFIECNRWSPVTTREMFAGSLDLADAALGVELERASSRGCCRTAPVLWLP